MSIGNDTPIAVLPFQVSTVSYPPIHVGAIIFVACIAIQAMEAPVGVSELLQFGVYCMQLSLRPFGGFTRDVLPGIPPTVWVHLAIPLTIIGCWGLSSSICCSKIAYRGSPPSQSILIQSYLTTRRTALRRRSLADRINYRWGLLPPASLFPRAPSTFPSSIPPSPSPSSTC